MRETTGTLARRGLFAMAAALLLASPAMAADEARKAEAKAMVDRGIADVARLGPEAAFAVMNTGEAGGYKQHELYIFVVEVATGKVVAQANDQGRVGMEVRTMKDVDGVPYGELFMEKATPEGAWVAYRRENPVTKQIEPKESFVVRSGDYIYGVGVYN
jgi:cytochrome c